LEGFEELLMAITTKTGAALGAAVGSGAYG